MDKIKRVEELVQLLNHYSDAYYNQNNPIVSDKEFDDLFDELVRLENETRHILPNSPTQRVGYEIKSQLEKVQHSIPLLSLDKTKSVDDLKKFIGNYECLLSLKLDGLTTKLQYDNGKLQLGATRGSGTEGEVITHSVKTIKSIPKFIPFKNKIEVVAESFIKYDDFEKINSTLSDEDKYKNPRNLTAGSVRQLDSSICAKRNVNAMIFNVIEIEGEEFETKSEQLEWLKYQGFEIVPYVIVDKNNIEQQIEKLQQFAKDLKIPIDGLVLTYNDIQYSKSLGVTNHHPKDSIAFKFYDDLYETQYTGTEYNTTRTGMISITGLYKPVLVDGTEIERASLHNVDIFEALELGIGDTIQVYKANQIIPQIADNLTRSNTEKLPTECPTCGSPIEIVKKETARFLYCTNDNCEAKLLGKLSHFVSRQGMNIEGLSESTLEKFIKLGWIKYLSDIYTLYQYKDKMMKLDGFGKRSVEKLLDSIEKSKTVPFDKFINALGIPNVGLGTAKRLAKHYDTIFSLLNTNYRELLQIEDIGDTVANSIIEYISNQDNQEEINSLLSEQHGGIKIQYLSQQTQNNNSEIAGKTFVVTGTFSKMKRKDIEKRIEELGGKVSGSVSKNTHMLLAGEKAGSKLDKAKNLGVTIIADEDTIVDMLN